MQRNRGVHTHCYISILERALYILLLSPLYSPTLGLESPMPSAAALLPIRAVIVSFLSKNAFIIASVEANTSISPK